MDNKISALVGDASIRMTFCLKKLSALTEGFSRQYNQLHSNLEQRVVTTIISEYSTYANTLSVIGYPGVVQAIARGNWAAQEWINTYIETCGKEEESSARLASMTFSVRRETGQLLPQELETLRNAQKSEPQGVEQNDVLRVVRRAKKSAAKRKSAARKRA